MTRLAVLSDVHGNLIALEATLAAIRDASPDAILVAGDLVLNGPDLGGAVDAIRALDAEGALIVSGNTDIAVADFDYGAAFPQYADGVPDAVQIAAEWAHDELSEEQLGWLRRLPRSAGCARPTTRSCSSSTRRPGRRRAGSTRPSTPTRSSTASAPPTRGWCAWVTRTCPRSATSAGR